MRSVMPSFSLSCCCCLVHGWKRFGTSEQPTLLAQTGPVANNSKQTHTNTHKQYCLSYVGSAISCFHKLPHHQSRGDCTIRNGHTRTRKTRPESRLLMPLTHTITHTFTHAHTHTIIYLSHVRGTRHSRIHLSLFLAPSPQQKLTPTHTHAHHTHTHQISPAPSRPKDAGAPC
jgi:hypothetical protein